MFRAMCFPLCSSYEPMAPSRDLKWRKRPGPAPSRFPHMRHAAGGGVHYGGGLRRLHRRPTPHAAFIRKGFGRILGVHFGSVNVRIALTDFAGNVIEYLKDESHANMGPEVALHHLYHLMDQV